MKKTFVILMLALFGVIASAQLRNDQLDSLRVSATTLTRSVTYNDYYQGSTKYAGIVGYCFTIKNYADTFNYVKLQGSYDGTNWVNIKSQTTFANGNYSLYDAAPVYLKYRLEAKTASGDVATLKNITYFEK
jgi:hypothetical protein